MEYYEYRSERFFGTRFQDCMEQRDSSFQRSEGWEALWNDVTTYEDGAGNPATSLYVVYRRKNLNK